eukprot:6451925-Pyramimonas_sp.AAC.1
MDTVKKERAAYSLPCCDWCPLWAYSLSSSAIGARYGHTLSLFLRLVPTMGIFSLFFCDWCLLWAYSLSSSVIGARPFPLWDSPASRPPRSPRWRCPAQSARTSGPPAASGSSSPPPPAAVTSPSSPLRTSARTVAQ